MLKMVNCEPNNESKWCCFTDGGVDSGGWRWLLGRDESRKKRGLVALLLIACLADSKHVD